MDALRVYSLLQESCRLLEANQDFAIAAMVGQAMAMVTESYGIGRDHLDDFDH